MRQEIEDGRSNFEAANRRSDELIAQLQQTNEILLNETSALKEEASHGFQTIKLKAIQSELSRCLLQSSLSLTIDWIVCLGIEDIDRPTVHLLIDSLLFPLKKL